PSPRRAPDRSRRGQPDPDDRRDRVPRPPARARRPRGDPAPPPPPIGGVMPHPRQLIRYAVANMLTTANVAGGHVEAMRIDPYRKGDLPAVAVYTTDEVVDEKSDATAPRELTRKLTLEIAGWVAAGDGVDDRLDDLAAEIEAAMSVDVYLAGTAGDSIL